MDPYNDSQGGGSSNANTPDQNAAAANLIRTQINALYGNQPVAPTSGQPVIPVTPTVRTYLNPEEASLAGSNRIDQTKLATSEPLPVQTQYAQPLQPVSQVAQPTTGQPAAAQSEPANPYVRTHAEHPLPQDDQWKAYHSAWQQYYQKYYEGYYAQQTKQQQTQQLTQLANNPDYTQPLADVAQAVAEPGSTNGPDKNGFFTQKTDLEQTSEDLSKDQALNELRQKLLGKVQTQASKIRRSKHFMPIAAATLVVLIFVFIQFNRVFIGVVNAYVSPGAINPQNIVVDPSKDISVGPDPMLIIPKINVEVPVIYDTTPAHDNQMAAMEKGVAHFGIPGANSRPGEVGNTVLSGHSSNDLFDVGDYKFIFAQLEKLTVGDTIYANYNSVRYTYVVTRTEVVKPTEVSKLIYPTDKPVMTLITCTPLGTALNRLLVTAEQISPDPSAAAAAPAGSGQDATKAADMPGTAPTLFERLFGAN